MGIKERRERERQELRGKILDAAREIFATEGFVAVTMRELAKRIEYSPAAIYLHFKDKEAVFAELCRTDLDEMCETLEKLASSTASPLERIKASSKAFVEFGLSHPSQYQILFMMPKPRRSDKSFVDPYRTAYETMRRTFEGLVSSGALKSRFCDADLTAQAYFCGLHGIVSAAIAATNNAPPDWRKPAEQAAFFVESLLEGLLK